MIKTDIKKSFVVGLILGLVLLISCLPEQQPGKKETMVSTPPGNQPKQDLPAEPNITSSSFPLSSPPSSSSPLSSPSSPLSTPVQNYRPPLGATVIYNQENIIFEHYWPNTASLKGDESEILVYNEGTASVQITSSDQIFILGSRRYSQYSGTWEKFPSRQSWERLQYLNINPRYYDGTPLTLEPGQKGKLHWHYQFGGDVSHQQQAAEISITFIQQEKSYSLDRKLVREGAWPYPSVGSASKNEH